jgi:hypothetical protein
MGILWYLYWLAIDGDYCNDYATHVAEIVQVLFTYSFGGCY